MPRDDCVSPEERAKHNGMTRRSFLKLSGGAVAVLGVATIATDGLASVAVPGKKSTAMAAGQSGQASAATTVTEWPVIWLAAGACTGCSVSFLNTLSPRVQDVLVSEVVPGNHISLRFHATVMAGEGEKAMEALNQTVTAGGFVLVAEGGFSTKDNGVYCRVGEENGVGITALEHLKRAAPKALAVIAIGTCAAYGGIPAAKPNPTGIKTVSEIFKSEGITTPLINVPGCPPNPDWFVGTIAQVLIGGLASVKLDDNKRPEMFYGKRIHDNCPRRGYYDVGKFAVKPSDPYCLYQLGCKGPVTFSDCPIRLWNSGTNWCIGCGHPCIGCVEPGFPDEIGSTFTKASGVREAGWHNNVGLVGLAIGGAAVAGAVGHGLASAAAGRFKAKEEENLEEET